jgi:formylglycine-generating enzyme required for sulfatase activity
MYRFSFFVLIGLFSLNLSLLANNLNLSAASVDGNSVGFEISWNNSWNFWQQEGSHDAIWVFVKGKTLSGLWEHIDLKNESEYHSAMSPLLVEAVNDGKGVFIYCQNSGIYSIPSTSVSLATFTDISNYIEIKIFGIEMVHIPQGEFYMGDGASISSIGGAGGSPLLISSEDEMDGNTLSIVNPNQVFDPQPLSALIPSHFPKGFASFYVMKYEISQVQYVDFLNTLTYSQQQTRTAVSPSSAAGTYAMVNPTQPDSLYRNGIAIVTSGSFSGNPAVFGINANGNAIFNETTDGLFRAANFLCWADISAYLDWAALRPITEMEFEKVCRGVANEPVAGEFAWGSSSVTNANSPLNDGTLFEVVSEVPIAGSGLANHGNIIAVDGWGLRGTLRNGFAAHESTGRLEAGASFYGVMELSGNVWEQTVIAAGEGVNFTGNMGDGILDANGDANQASWCNPNTAFGVLLKGGGWGSAISAVGSWRDLAVSDRFYSHLNPLARKNTAGGRGGR